MDSILSYFSAVKIKDFQAKLTANKNNMTYEKFMKAQEVLNDPKKFVEKNVEKKFQITGFWNEFVNINSSTDTDGQSNKIFAMLMQAAFDFGF